MSLWRAASQNMAGRSNHRARIPPDERDRFPYLPSYVPPMPHVRFDTARVALFDDANDQPWADETESTRGDSLGNAPSWGLSSTLTTPPDESPPLQDESRPSPQRRQDHMLGSLDVSTFESAEIGAQESYMMTQEGNVRFIPPNVALSPLTANPRVFTQDC
jgi:hypothetical protein